MTFQHDPATDEGLLRTLTQDADSTDYVFEDDELTNVLDQNEGDVWAAAADLCRALAAKYTKAAVNINLGKYDLVVDTRKKAEYFLSLAMKYDSRSNGSQVDYWDSIDYNVDNAGKDNAEYIGDE